MKKIIALLSMLIIISSVGILTSYAEKSADVVVESTEAHCGDVIDVHIQLKNNGGILALMFNLTYDQSRLMLVETKAGDIVDGPVFSRTVNEYPYIMLWNSASYNDFTEDGTLATLTFAVLDTADEGQAFINLDYEKENIYDVDFGEVQLNIQNGYIDVIRTDDKTNETSETDHHSSSGSRNTVAIKDFAETLTTDVRNQIILQVGNTEAFVFGEFKINDVAPIIRHDRTMLPARFVSENLGANVEWVDTDRKVIIQSNNKEIILFVDRDIAYVDGNEYNLDSPVFIEEDRTYTPVRFIAEQLGATVDWYEGADSVVITRSQK
ncbi:MAG: hypothetical protein IJG16_06800 [Clostridia bacterium]|nr:hypothetical protein [Clostridia bacterium]